MFNFPTVLLVRLTRDISAYFIKQGKMYLQVDAPQNALTCFNHARNLEIQANERDKGKLNSNTKEPNCSHIDFREHLDMLEGDGGLISRAKEAVRTKEYSLEDS
ncbi:unnamed protein product [Rotaria sordida]|uniref:Uncharacterized protein n=1 Tax=Rotaria sordida TaxID=392033 RepID=A0A819NJW4_9BILA|nr:unnamed protein product [Rotaria sordida]CAF3997111.1 unnamed protein product [Rotaria sordida]